MIRKPAAVGFYPQAPDSLNALLEELFSEAEQKGPFRYGVSPHAGYIYSGLAAASLFKSLKKSKKLVILGVDHHGIGYDIVLHPYSAWETPLGRVEIDHELAASVEEIQPQVYPCPNEHSIEVQLPFLQFLWGDFGFLPITVPSVPFSRLEELGRVLSELKVPVIASSDMSHFVDSETAARLDMLAIDQILKKDARGLLDTVLENRISMCGVFPVASLLSALPRDSKGDLVMYYNSGDITGDRSSVVGYASVGFG